VCFNPDTGFIADEKQGLTGRYSLAEFEAIAEYRTGNWCFKLELP